MAYALASAFWKLWPQAGRPHHANGLGSHPPSRQRPHTAGRRRCFWQRVGPQRLNDTRALAFRPEVLGMVIIIYFLMLKLYG